MKKILFFILLVFVAIPCDAIESKYYSIEGNKWTFNELSKDEQKKLSKEEKVEYKKIAKANKYLSKGNLTQKTKFYLKAIQNNPNLIPAYEKLAWHYFYEPDYNKAISYADYVLKNDSKNYPRMNAILGFSYYYINNYDNACKYLESLLATKPTEQNMLNDTYLALAFSYLDKYKKAPNDSQEKKQLGQKTIEYANKISWDNKYDAAQIRYCIFYDQGKLELALKEAWTLFLKKQNFENSMKIANCTKNENEKLKAYYDARELASNENEYMFVNDLIIYAEQKKIDDSIKNLKVFVKKPSWKEVLNSTSYGTLRYWKKRQDDFFKSTNNCIRNHNGNNLAACFEQVNLEQEKLTNKLNEEVYRQEQAAMQQQMLRQQQMSNYYSALNAYYAQKNANYSEQNAYYTKQNYLQNIMPKNYVITPKSTPFGNYIQVNQYY